MNFEDKRYISEGLKDLIIRILEKDPRQRFDINDLKTNAWVNEGLPPLAVLTTPPQSNKNSATLSLMNPSFGQVRTNTYLSLMKLV